MLRQEISWFDARSSGHLAERLASEAPLIKTFTGESLAGVIELCVTLLAGVTLAAYASWKLTASSIIFLPLMCIGQIARMRAMQKTNETEAGPMVSEAMGNIKSVAAFSMQVQILRKYNELLEAEYKKLMRSNVWFGIANAWGSCMQFIFFGCVIALANVFINEGWLDGSDVLAVLMPIMTSAGGLAQAAQWMGDKAKGKKAINHIFNTLDRVPHIDAYMEDGDKLERAVGRIRFEHVSFSYPMRPDVTVFVDFDLEIEPNTNVAFCGPSGSGKSTTINLLQRFYDPAGGRVLLDGHDIKSLNLRWLRSQMSLVQQEPILFAGSIEENIRYGREDASSEDVRQAARSANAHSFIMDFPRQYDTDVGERGAKLSGGQKQRVAIARSMVRDPKVLLLDEATSALDTESEKIVQEALDKLLEQSCRTTLVIAHRLSTIVNSDVICVIYQGKIVEKGSHHKLMELDGHYKQLAQRQEDATA